MEDRLKKFIEDNKDEIVDLLCQLIAAKTENPPGNEILAVDIVEEYFKKNKIRYKIFEKEPSRANIVGYVGRGKPELLIVCHLDVVPAGNGWYKDPFKAYVSNNRVIGRGANDNKGQMASMMVLVKFLKENEALLNGTFILVGAADEERGSVLGAEYLVAECGLTADYAIIPDVSHNMELIDVSEKGALFLNIISYGRQAHGSTPELGINAIWNMIELLEKVKEKIAFKFKNEKHPLHSPPTFNLGTIKGGATNNIVPGECHTGLDFRYLPGDSSASILQVIDNCVEEVRKLNKSAKFEVNVEFDLLPSEVDKDNELVNMITKRTESILNVRPKVRGMSGATVNKQLIARGITSVGFGPGDTGCAHIANESIDITELVDFAKIIGLVTGDLLS